MPHICRFWRRSAPGPPGGGAFGLTTAANYARSGWIDWPLAAVFIGGGILGGIVGTILARRLSGTQGALHRLYASVVFLGALYMIYRSATDVGVMSHQ